ncbi:M48 family peptidase [Bacillus sp. HMF5848]|uniref:M48 family metallopeptidase n=1 Tax=Bacillus sp. HMF5848 TaxID=2495421 RepID=UPI000F7AD76D|nr:SprT family zinc-dependent metalloprotease [Bacillus sp. HMF5848]RSK25858.1 M48 family peptidase [Bacillus sp. HMF5848]
MIHTHLNETIRFEIKYKNRKSIGISIDGYGNVEVQAPKGISEDIVIRAVEEKWSWIQEKLQELNERAKGFKQKVYDEGETFLYLGETYPIRFTHDGSLERDIVEFRGDALHINVKQLDDDAIKQALKRFYYQQCKALVEKSVASYQSHFKMKPRSIRITDSKTTWGTCDSNRQLTFNWRLAMAPPEVLDYVVVHEMCHMMHMNHDRSFWRLVGKIMPDYKEQEQWLTLSNWKMTV